MRSDHRFGGDWTDDKLQRLSKYLKAYMQIFKSNEAARFYTTTYVDGFAGTGYRLQGDKSSQAQSLFDDEDASNFRKGSAATALECEPAFDRYIFVERNPAFASELQRLRAIHTTHNITVHPGDANAFLKNWCETTDWYRNRAVVFLDPYGMEVEWSTIERIASTKAIDMWWLFPPVHRLLPRDGPNEKWSAALTRTLGTDDWRRIFYQPVQRPNLFGMETDIERTASVEKIKRFVVERLRLIFVEVAPKPLELLNSKKVPIYLLCFAASNPKGAKTAIKIANHILRP